MHELSIVASIVDAVVDALAAHPGARVLEVRLRIGALSSVVRESLEFCYGLATEETPLAGSRLSITVTPILGFCTSCSAEVEIASVQSMRCPRCQEPILDLRQGRELEIDSIEIEDAVSARPPENNERLEANR